MHSNFSIVRVLFAREIALARETINEAGRSGGGHAEVHGERGERRARLEVQEEHETELAGRELGIAPHTDTDGVNDGDGLRVETHGVAVPGVAIAHFVPSEQLALC